MVAVMLDFPLITRLGPGQVSIRWTDNSRPRFAEVDAAIETAWRHAMARPGVHLFDGPMCRLESFEQSGDSLRLVLSRENYKNFLGTNLTNAHLADRFGQAALANGTGMSCALLSGDGKLLLGRRTARVAYYPGRVHPFAGALEPREELDVFADMKRELAEELALEERDLSEITLTGIAIDRSLRQPELIFAAGTSVESGRIERQLEMTEHAGVLAVAARHDAVEALLRSEEPFTPIGIAAILLWGRQAFGTDWFSTQGARFIAG